MKLLLDLAESGIIPDTLVRLGIRALNRRRLLKEAWRERAGQGELLQYFLDDIRSSPIALETRAANEQHYEVPPAFFEKVLGRRLKYGCCHWPPRVKTLDAAEEAMLALTATRAEVADGMDILDLGCGWGSFTLWTAENFPHSRILAVSNSTLQGNFIREKAANQGLKQVTALCPWRCSSTCATGRSSWNDSPAGSNLRENSSCMSSVTGVLPTSLRPSGRRTGWGVPFSPGG
jgi:cyclopropane-fatty-acyl-phospholipid synthase